jgi:phosphoribosylglycinamide formyltransferase-1
MTRIAVFASGRGTNFENLITSYIPNSSFILLITDTICEALAIAKRYHIESRTFQRDSFTSRKEMEMAITTLLEARNIDLIVLAGYMRLLSPWFVRRFDHRIVNIHPSLLPHYKGINAIAQAFEDGKQLYGVSVHYVNEGMDEGGLIAQRRLYYKGKHFEELEKLVHQTEYELYPQVIRTLCKKEKQ